jgi:two-component system, NarL family, response regulator NreC
MKHVALGLGRLRVLIADDHTMVRESLVAVLNASDQCDVVAEAADGIEAVEKAVALRPDIAILDIAMPGLNGIEVVRRLHEEAPETRTLVLTMHDEEEYVLRAVRAGASGYLLKDSPTAELIAAINDLRCGRGHYGAYAARILAEQVHQPDRVLDDPYGSLTPREREVFHLLIEGMTTKEIARKLEVSVKTAENHRSRVMDKLKARNVANVVRYAIRKGLID